MVSCSGHIRWQDLRFYINGMLDSNQVSTNLHFGVVDEPITIGADLPGGDEYFKGTIRDVRVYGRAISGAELNIIAAANHAPVFVPVNEQMLMAGQALSLTNVVSDVDVPPQTLTYSLMTAPSNATVTAVNQTNGVFNWRPRIADSPSTNFVALVVTDNGNPGLSATQNFKVSVARPATPTISSPAMLGSGFQLSVNGDTGPDYLLYAATNIAQTSWQLILQTNSPALPLQFTDPAGTNLPQRFYRIQLGP